MFYIFFLFCYSCYFSFSHKNRTLKIFIFRFNYENEAFIVWNYIPIKLIFRRKLENSIVM